MSQANARKRTRHSEVNLPQEHFWKCYSPQNEFPLSSVSSLALHGLVIGLLILIAYIRNLPRNIEASEPPQMDVVEIQGGGGTGGMGSGLGVGPQIAGQTTGKNPASAKLDSLLNETNPKQQTKLEVNLKQKKVEIPDPSTIDNKGVDAEAIFGAILSSAKEEVAKSMKVSPQELASAGNIGGSPGSGGGVGGGKGKGVGKHTGPGGGNSPKGVVLSKQQKREMRWAIHFSGDGYEHLRKLKALDVTLAIPTPQRGMFRLVDLSGVAPRFHLSDLSRYSKKVKWFNVNRASLMKLRNILKLRHTPKYVVIFLPEGMEETLAQLEFKYQGRPEHQIQYTVFEITQRSDGSYGPVVVEQKLKPGVGK